MSDVIDLKIIIGVVANSCNLQLFANIFVRTVLTDLLNTSCQHCQHCDEQQF